MTLAPAIGTVKLFSADFVQKDASDHKLERKQRILPHQKSHKPEPVTSMVQWGWIAAEVEVLHEVVRSAARYGSQCSWRGRDAFEEETTVDGKVGLNVGHGAVDAITPPSLTRLPRNCRNKRVVNASVELHSHLYVIDGPFSPTSAVQWPVVFHHKDANHTKINLPYWTGFGHPCLRFPNPAVQFYKWLFLPHNVEINAKCTIMKPQNFFFPRRKNMKYCMSSTVILF